MSLTLGCMNRPYNRFPFERILDGIAAAGFTAYVHLQRQPDAWIDAKTPLDEAKRVHDAILKRGLTLVMLPSSIPVHQLTDDEALELGRGFVDRAAALSVPFLLDMGAHQPESYDRYFALMRRLAPYAADHGVTIAVKPHGGATTTGADCLRAIERVNHPAYRLCFDPGNLLYYANERPETHLADLAPFTVAMCVKDEVGGLRGDVNVTPGDGDVDFPAVFRGLYERGFRGPCVIECLALKNTPEEEDGEARRAYAFLSGIVSNLS
ncbi:MAG: sugar phosphate isomerase/epimerase [Chloroflexi bacterium]|nr:sugar phosphate isomerase/epimerase [Chloroflexota bacterium]